MFFKRIEMHGFKSFADPVVVEFDKGITCVVGPNGSGKSNISDAIRWVLGEQSPKMLRGGKMEDIIFSGTQSRKSRGMAEVSLVIDNSQGKLPIDYSEVAITRRMYRSGESEYAINNNQCRMRDIRELLSDTGIGVDGYSLIGQGKISEIISNKKESIREIFEESAGIVSYRNKKAESERKLEQTKINMDRANDIIFEIESRIDNLRDESQRAKGYLQLKDRYRELEIGLITSNLSLAEENIKVFIDDTKQLESQIDELHKGRDDVERKIEENRKKLEDIKEDTKEKDYQLEELNSSINSKTSENSIGRERISGIENNKLRIKRELALLRQEIEEEEKKLASYEKLKSEKVGDLSLKEEEARNLEEKLAIKKEELATLVEKCRGEENKLFLISKEEDATRQKIEELKKRIETLGEETFDEASDKLRELSLAKEEETKINKTIKSLDIEIDEAKKNLQNQETSLQEIMKEKLSLENEVNQLNLVLGKDEARRKTLVEMEEDYQGYQHSVRFLMKQSIDGVFGVVADIINVESGLEVAIETALGASIQNVVVDREERAKEAIELLKKNKAGRGTFLPLNRIKPKEVNRRNIDVVGVLGYGDELVSCDEKYRDVVKFLLGTTIVVENIDTAIHISKREKGFKFVTKSGDVIFATGAMSGGSQKNKVGNLFERKKEIENLGKIIEANTEKVANIKEKLSEIYSDEERLKLDIKELSKSLEEKKIREKNTLGDKLELSSQINTLEKQVQELKASEENKKQSIFNFENEADEKKNTLLSLEKEREELKVSVNNLFEEEKEARDLLEAEERELVEIKLQIARVIQETQGNDNLVNMLKQNLQKLREEVSFRENQTLNIEADLKAIQEGIGRRSEEISRLTLERDEILESKKSKEQALEQQSKTYHQLILDKDAISKQLSMIQQQKYEIDIKLAKFQAQEKSLKDRLWEELEISYAEAMAMPKIELSQSALVRENREIKNKIKSLGDINIGAIKEYDEISERYGFLTKEKEDIQTSLDQLNEIISSMDKEIKKKFKESFDSISSHFEEIFKEFFGGGIGKIEIDNIDDPLNANIDIVAQPPGKQLRNINLLSGGEKTMTAIALMFAVLKTKPTPCCILDEVEAALDDNNIHIFGNYLKKFEDIQFTLITHQKATMEHADVMYGITMPERGISKVYSLKMGEELAV